MRLKAMVRAGRRRVRADRGGDRRLALDAGRTAGAGAVPFAARKGIRRGSAGAGRNADAAGGAPYPAQCAWPGDHRRYHRCRGGNSSRNPPSPSSGSAFRRISRPGGASCSTARIISTSRRIGRLFPGAAIFLAVVTINFIGDGLRDALDASAGFFEAGRVTSMQSQSSRRPSSRYSWSENPFLD